VSRTRSALSHRGKALSHRGKAGGCWRRLLGAAVALPMVAGMLLPAPPAVTA
jgi:hypothetical protein